MFEKEIERGVAFLDTRYPDWVEKVKPEELNMRNPSTCMLGQVDDYDGVIDNPAFRDWVKEQGFLADDMVDYAYTSELATMLGFNVDAWNAEWVRKNMNTDDVWTALQQEWLEMYEARRKASTA